MKGARRCFLSTCGTSLLTNGRAPHERSLVTRYSNAKRQEAIPSDDAATLVQIIAEVRVQLLSAEPQQVASMSAELNTLLRYYDGHPLPSHDAHLLLCTDTWLGEEAARLVADYLQAQDCSNSLVIRRRDLQTAELTSFQLALSELVRWFEENLPTYRAQGFQVVFNLTGGFKSVQGFLQALAPFYADEVVYIFESHAELLRIPRLPVRMATPEVLRKHLTMVRRLALGLPTATDPAVPEALLLTLDGQVSLSPWGELIWQQTRREIYREQLWPSPSPRLIYGPHFAESVRTLDADRLTTINERLDDLACFLERADKPNPNRLDFKPLRGRQRLPSTHECDAWADGDARRLFGHYQGGDFVLDLLDKKL